MYTFPKKEHLCGDKNIENLYENGKAMLVYPFRIVYVVVEEESEPVRVLVSVSKKKFKKAVDRNRTKRLIRECYRLNKTEIITYANENGLKLHLGFQYIGSVIEPFQRMSEKMQIALEKIIKNVVSWDENTKKDC